VLATLRGRLRGSNIWVAGSRDYRAFEDYLLPPEAGRDIGLDGGTDPERYTVSRTGALHERLTFVAEPAGRGNSTGSRSRTANSTSRAPRPPSPRLGAIWPFG
jgi:hypothetical protein